MRKEIEEIYELRKRTAVITCSDFIKKINSEGIIIYGAGAFGRETYDFLKKNGVVPRMFLDRGAVEGQTIEGIPVIKPGNCVISQEIKESVNVYIAITIPFQKMKPIIDSLHDMGFANVYPVQTLMGHQVGYDDCEDENPNDGYINKVQSKIEQAYELMEDEESRATFLSCIRAHLLRDYDGCFETEFQEQYFDAGVKLNRGMKNFVDCGAYNGDSLISILRHVDSLKNYIAFEPIASNIEGLSKTVEENKNKIEQAIIYPCGLSNRTGVAYFSNEASASSIVKEEEGDVLPIVRLDDVILKMKIDFIKMDIEGAEVDALEGAKRTIKEQAPDLAISSYHKVNHYWDIPNMIYEINPNYKFYLRTHTPGTLETVLYCTME